MNRLFANRRPAGRTGDAGSPPQARPFLPVCLWAPPRFCRLSRCAKASFRLRAYSGTLGLRTSFQKRTDGVLQVPFQMFHRRGSVAPATGSEDVPVLLMRLVKPFRPGGHDAQVEFRPGSQVFDQTAQVAAPARGVQVAVKTQIDGQPGFGILQTLGLPQQGFQSIQIGGGGGRESGFSFRCCIAGSRAHPRQKGLGALGKGEQPCLGVTGSRTSLRRIDAD